MVHNCYLSVKHHNTGKKVEGYGGGVSERFSLYFLVSLFLVFGQVNDIVFFVCVVIVIASNCVFGLKLLGLKRLIKII